MERPLADCRRPSYLRDAATGLPYEEPISPNFR